MRRRFVAVLALVLGLSVAGVASATASTAAPAGSSVSKTTVQPNDYWW